MWNYRIIKRKANGKELFGLYEVYYDEDKKVDGFTEAPLEPYEAESVNELLNFIRNSDFDFDNSYKEEELSPTEFANEVKHIYMAFNRPILDYDTLT